MNIVSRKIPLIAGLAISAAALCSCTPDKRDLPERDGADVEDLVADEGGEGIECPAGEIACGSACIDPDKDEKNCGGCGFACGVLEQCVEGDCVCMPPYLECGEECVDPSMDRRHCGECGNACDVLAGCEEGVCACPEGLTSCSGRCVDLDSNNDHCGSCENACTGGTFCNGSGVCSLECEPGYTLCGVAPDRYCADLDSSALDCGECGHACQAYDHATPRCEAGECAFVCDSGYGDANGTAEDGCECTITEGGSEVCDGVDNDCDGAPDDGFECVQGIPEYRNCGDGSCGSQGRNCLSDCRWSSWGPCNLKTGSSCFDGQVQDQDCGDGNCGTQSKTCSSCSWGGWSGCELDDGNDCFDDQTEIRSCGAGNCGEETRSCSSCSWGGWSSCELKAGNDCWTGNSQTGDCGGGNCGHQVHTCLGSCLWGTWEPCELKPGNDCFYDGYYECCEYTMINDGRFRCEPDCSWGDCVRCVHGFCCLEGICDEECPHPP